MGIASVCGATLTDSGGGGCGGLSSTVETGPDAPGSVADEEEEVFEEEEEEVMLDGAGAALCTPLRVSSAEVVATGTTVSPRSSAAAARSIRRCLGVVILKSKEQRGLEEKVWCSL